MPKVSVIIPTYNLEAYICEAINSVFSQTYKDFEIIVVDDGSTDKTYNILNEKYGNSIRYFYQNNKGVSAARNLGIKEAFGEYIAFLDADDIWYPEKLTTQINIIDGDMSLGLVASYMDTINSNSEKSGIRKPARKPGDNYENALIEGSAPPSSFIIRKECFKRIGVFDENLKMFEDLDIYTRITEKYKVKTIDNILGGYRIHNSNMTKDDYRVYKNQICLAKKWLQSNLSQETKNYLLKKTRKYALLLLKNALKNLIIPDVSRYFLCLIFPSYNSQKKTQFQNNTLVINILFYEASSGAGGSANALYNILKHIDKTKFLSFFAYKDKGSQIEKIEALGIKGIKLGETVKNEAGNSYLNFIFEIFCSIIPESIKISRIIKSKHIKIVHINTNILSGIPAIIAAKLSNIPCICHIRQTRKLIKRERFFIKHINKFIVLNNDAYELYSKDIPKEKLISIYDGLDPDEFKGIKESGIKNEFNLQGYSCIGIIGRIVNGKGQKEFILAAKEVLRFRKDVKFLIVGDAKGDDDKYFKDTLLLVKKENLENDIIFAGWRNDIKNIVSELDIIVHASTLPEGLGSVIIEAMALEKPIIATKIPGSMDIVINNETGYLIIPGDTRAIAEKILYLLDNSALAKRMGAAGRKRVIGLFNINKNVKYIEKEYDNLLSIRSKINIIKNVK